MYGSRDMKHDRQNFLLFWAIFHPFTQLTTQKIKILKKWKKAWQYQHFTHVCQKLWSNNVQFLRYGAQWTDWQTDGQTDEWTERDWKSDIEVDVPPNNQYEELLEKNNTHTVMGNRTYRWKQPSLDHLQTPKQNQKEYLSKIGYKVGGGIL